MRTNILRCAAALIAACLSVSQAAADSVSLVFDSTASSSGVSGTVNGNSFSGIPGPYYWHESNPPSGSPFSNPTTTFCVELTQHISTGNTYTYTYTPLASTPGVSSTEADMISKLWGAHYNAAWSNSSFTGSSDSTAFQLALWEIVYDNTNSLNLGNGNLQIASADTTAINTAQAWLDGLSGVSSDIFSTNFSNSQLVWLSNGSSQDQLTMLPNPATPRTPSSVPAPPGVVLSGIGFLVLLGRSRWLRR